MVLAGALEPLGFSPAQIERLVAASGPSPGQPYGFTFSDLIQRLVPAIVLDAYPSRAIDPSRALEVAKGLNPTPPFLERAA
jgi:hypothetical protein